MEVISLELLTPEEIAEQLHVSKATVLRWLRQGRLVGVRLGRRAGWRVEKEDLTKFLESLKVRPPKDASEITPQPKPKAKGTKAEKE